MKKLLYIFLGLSLIFACSDSDNDSNEPCPSQPSLETGVVTQIELNNSEDIQSLVSATFSGEIINNPIGVNCETLSITSQGFTYATHTLPTIDDESISSSGQNVNASVSNLNPDSTYYVRTYLTNTLGTFYGNEVSFETPESSNPIYLDDNGVTIKAKDWAEPGMIGFINGVEYTIADNQFFYNFDNWAGNNIPICTSLVDNYEGNYTFLGTNWESFSDEYLSNVDIGNWDVSNFVNMSGIFVNVNTVSSQDLSNWDVSNVTDMQAMFVYSSFSPDISNWDVSNVIDMAAMFYESSSNSDISNWNVGSLTRMFRMFYGSSSNLDISNWDVSNVTDMNQVFSGASVFNQDISNWDVSNVTTMYNMFVGATQFNQDLSSWEVTNVTNCDNFSFNTNSWTLPQPNFTNCNPD